MLTINYTKLFALYAIATIRVIGLLAMATAFGAISILTFVQGPMTTWSIIIGCTFAAASFFVPFGVMYEGKTSIDYDIEAQHREIDRIKRRRKRDKLARTRVCHVCHMRVR